MEQLSLRRRSHGHGDTGRRTGIVVATGNRFLRMRQARDRAAAKALMRATAIMGVQALELELLLEGPRRKIQRDRGVGEKKNRRNRPGVSPARGELTIISLRGVLPLPDSSRRPGTALGKTAEHLVSWASNLANSLVDATEKGLAGIVEGLKAADIAHDGGVVLSA